MSLLSIRYLLFVLTQNSFEAICCEMFSIFRYYCQIQIFCTERQCENKSILAIASTYVGHVQKYFKTYSLPLNGANAVAMIPLYENLTGS